MIYTLYDLPILITGQRRRI